MAEEIKKVIYSFIHSAGFSPDEEEQKELDEMARKRDGYLHRFAEVDIDGVRKCVAIIEDAETGNVVQLEDPTLVSFVEA